MKKGVAVPNSLYTYAVGRLTLLAIGEEFSGVNCLEALRGLRFTKMAIANPKTAPYGLAARQVLTKLKLWERLQPRLVRGENIAQTLHFLISGSAQMGLIATSMVNALSGAGQGCRWDIPGGYHAPIRQRMVLLFRGAKNKGAHEFIAFLKSPPARRIIREFGYASEGG